nr:hypothetical protein [Tsukamurella ocularis]
MELRVPDCDGSIATEGRLPGEQLERCCREGVSIGLRAQILRSQQFGRGVRDRKEQVAVVTDRRRRRQGLRRSEVGQVPAGAVFGDFLDEDVAGLDIPMQDTCSVTVVEGAADIDQYGKRDREVGLDSAARHEVGGRVSVHVLQGDPRAIDANGSAALAREGSLADIDGGDDVRTVDSSSGVELPLEALTDPLAVVCPTSQLQRDGLLAGPPGEEHVRGATAAEPPKDGVLGDDVSDLGHMHVL